ncbi:isopentenyl phosphate kinase [Halorussus gelatinilyticus]|uniref:Isopentenyl phosphate kinase n=1 Tax=Halorussus gelatinilyticus TaxID=2937524 RepID=A0A8U0IMI4_9EURY|nr:isopentenyl phosphate kinase [Halorussus gelatinilyticus]UPW02347.1 isopentenyl phosphate kinase [Halorussus gelatinilyticus]
MTDGGTETTVLKLGGSVITDKDRPEALDGPQLDRAADAIAEALVSNDVSDLVVVHGGGSFGHHHASEHGVSKTEGSADARAAVEIHGAMKTLNDFVLARLHDRDVPAVPVHPFSAARRDESAALDLPTAQVETMLGEGFVPVLHGDVVAHAGEGVTVLSGDEVVTAVAEGIEADRVGFCSTVPGVLDDDEDVIPEIRSYDEVARFLGESDATDVTGGMAGKVRALLDLGAPATVFGPDALGEFLAGETPGTRIDGR